MGGARDADPADQQEDASVAAAEPGAAGASEIPGESPSPSAGHPQAAAPPPSRLEICLERLRRYNQGTPAPTAQALEQAEEQAFERLKAAEREEAERRCPSLRSIPRFYERRARDADESNSLGPRVLRVAASHLLHRKSTEDMLDEEDLGAILSLLREHARERSSEGSGSGGSGGVAGSVSPDVEVIDYEGFVRIGEELSKRGDRFGEFFTASTFLKFPRDQRGRMAIALFFTFLVRKMNIRQTRVQLSCYDVLGCGYLREKDMENFIFELIPTLPQLNTLQEEFYPFYVFTAVRKFFFFLDPKRTGRIRIRDLLSSQIIIELYELRHEQPLREAEAESNWFSMQSALKVYGAYLDLDVDQNGMLSKNELSSYGSGMLTEAFIDRVFEEYQTYRDSETGKREMDYKTFLDFVLAMENKNSRQAIQYFWKLIDIHHRGYLDGFVINYFFRGIIRQLLTKKIDVASVDDVKDEIFDMVKSRTPGIITMQDLVECRQGGTVLSMLIDAAAFLRYENREQLLMEPDDNDDDLKF